MTDYSPIDLSRIQDGAVFYAVMDEERGLVGAEVEFAYAADQAARIAGAGGLWSADSPPGGLGAKNLEGEQSYAANPPPPEFTGDWSLIAKQALAATGLSAVSLDQIMSIPLDEAAAIIRPYFPNTRYSPGENVWKPVDQWTTGRKMATPKKGLLRQNAKLEKDKGGGRGAVALGLNLVPERTVFRGYAGGRQNNVVADGPDDPSTGLPVRRLPIVRGGPKSTLCWRSTDECASVCLVNTGQNVSDRYNNVVKLATTRALLEQQLPFMRVLVEALDWHLVPKRKRWTDYIPYVRLNVLSDVPWELVCPELFYRYEGVVWKGRRHAFYDYTKIPGRTPPENYDLTFSYSGNPANKLATQYELERGSRVTVVFLLPYSEKVRKKKFESGPREGEYVHSLPQTWMGRRVIDGDRHDVRPRDPGGVWVGLRYKTARGFRDDHLGQIVTGVDEQGRKFRGRSRGTAGALRSFIVLVEKIDGQLVVAETPRHTPGCSESEEC